MKQQEIFRNSSYRFANYERRYTVYLIRKGTYYEDYPIYARSLYQAAAHCVHLFSYAFDKLGVIEAVILPDKASKSGLSVYRQKRGEAGVIKRLKEVIDDNTSVSDVLANWNRYKSVDHFIG